MTNDEILDIAEGIEGGHHFYAAVADELLIDFARAIIAQARAELIAELNPVAWSNPDEEGEPDMLFPSRSEAESYCDEDEEPIELVIKPKE